MYDNNFAPVIAARHITLITGVVASLMAALLEGGTAFAQLPPYQESALVRHISSPSEKLELISNTSRVLTLDKPIPRVVVNNPELLAVTPLSATQVQISAKKTGVTQVNLWDEEGNIHTVDVLIYGDARELELALQTQFPHSSIKVYRYSDSLVLTGFVDNPTHVSQIKLLADDYAPKVIMNIQVGGVQQVLLKVKVMEVNRTKLRKLGNDWAYFSSSGVGTVSSVSGLISEVAQVTRGADTITPNVEGGPGIVNNLGTFQFGVIDGGDTFFDFVDFLQERQVGRTLAEPNLVAVSGRPAQFIVGGEIPILIPQSLGTTSIEFKPFGTIIDFLPIVLGNGNIRLEVRPQVSERNDANGIQVQDIFVPGFNTRKVDTAVEMKAGQTFALAGLIQEKSVSRNSGIPYLSDLPILGVPFRKTENDVEEIELLVMVTPEFIDPLDPHEVPCGGPGTYTTYPNNHDLYCSGYVEVPLQCNPTSGLMSCGAECYGPQGCQCGQNPFATGGVIMPGGIGYENDGTGPTLSPSMPVMDQAMPGGMMPEGSPQPQVLPLPDVPDDLPLPEGAEMLEEAPEYDASLPRSAPPYAVRGQIMPQLGMVPQSTAPRPYSPPRQPVYMRNAPSPNNRQGAAGRPGEATGLIGPLGYDVE